MRVSKWIRIVKMFGQDFQNIRLLCKTNTRPNRKLLDTLRDFCIHDNHSSASSPVCLPATAVEVCLPLITSICSKDTDDSRKILRLAHYLLRRVLQSPHGKNIPSDILETLIATLKTKELIHKHIPRRMESLRTLTCCLNNIHEPETLVNELLLIVRSGLKNLITWKSRLATTKRRKEILALHQELWLAQSYFSTSGYILNSSVQQIASNISSKELLNYYIFGICSVHPAVARNCASQLLILAKTRSLLVANALLPLLPHCWLQNGKRSLIYLEEEFVCVKMLDVFCILGNLNKNQTTTNQHSNESVTKSSQSFDSLESLDSLDSMESSKSLKSSSQQLKELSVQYCKAIAFVLATDTRWRVILHAIRSLGNVSWLLIEQTQMAVNDGGDVVNVSIHSNGIEMDQKSKENDQNNNLMKLGKL